MLADLRKLTEPVHRDEPAGQLLRRLGTHDEQAWRYVIEVHGPRLRRLGRAHRLAAHEIEDALQATWLTLLLHVDQLRAPECLGAWLASSMRHECLRVLRTRGRRRECLVDDWACFADSIPGEDDEPDDGRPETAARAWRLVARLPQRQRELIRALYEPEPPSYAEVSARMAMPVGAIGPTRQRALRHLRLLLEDDGVPA